MGVAQKEKNSRLIFAGEGELAKLLRGQAAAMNLSDRVHFIGAVHEDDLVDVYRTAHVFSLVSDRGLGRGEGIPLTPLEAGACGIPILVGNQDGSREAVEEDTNGYILDPFDLKAHTAILLSLVASKETRDRLGAGARRRAEALYSTDAFTRKLEQIVIAEGGRS
jgi:phosphatidylinositol alpha-1,6-mannosyltransferase